MVARRFVIAAVAFVTTQCVTDRSFEGWILHGVPHLYHANGTLLPGYKPLRLLTQRPESGGVGDAMGKLVPVFEIVLRAVNNGSSVLPGYVVELYLTDSACKPETGVQSTIKLLNTYPRGFFKAIFGPLCSDPTGAVNDVVQAYNLFQIASISRSPALSNGLRYPYLCRLSPALSFVADGIMKTVQLFGWTRIGLLRDSRALSDSTIISMTAKLKSAREAFDAGSASGYPFNLEYSGLNSFLIDSTTDEIAVVASIKRSKVRVLVGAVYEDAGLRFFCELYKQGYVGKKLQFILATGWWADNWIEEQLGEQTNTTWQQSGGGCTREQVYEAAQDMASIAQATWFQSPGMKHAITQVNLFELKREYYTECSAGEGCHNDFAAADYDGLSTMVNAFDIWLRNNGSLSAIDYDSATPVQELYNITLQTDFLGVTGRVKFYDSDALACERQGSFTVKQYSNLPNAAGEDGWINRASFTNLDGFGLLQPWIPYHWQDGTETYFGSGTGWVTVQPGIVASFGSDATGLDNAISDWKSCPAGTTVDESGRNCINCSPGKYGQDGECKDCPQGTYASRDGMELCPNCPSGKYQNETGASNCTDCLAGTISDPESPWKCKSCPQGKLSSRDGLDVCDVCDTGTYQDQEGASACLSCAEELGDPFLSTTGTGATTSNECVCREDYFRTPILYSPAEASKCRPCPEGMECPDAGSSEEALLHHVSGTPVTQPGIAGVLLRRYPLVLEGYMSKTRDPFTIYRCLEKRHCPGGAPGSCDENRNTEEVGCARCNEGAYKTSEGLCELCENSNVALVIAMLGIGGILALTLVTCLVNSGSLQRQSSMMAVVIIIGILFTGIQTLGVYHNLNVIFFEPLSSLLSLMQVFTLNLSMLRMECMFPFSPISQYACRQLIAPICGMITGIICILKKLFVKKSMLLHVEYVNTVGTMGSIFFLAIVVSAMMPLNCYMHPGDSGSSVLASPSILCFGEDVRHTYMVVIGLISFSLVVVPFLSMAIWATCNYTRWTSSIGSRSSARLWMFRWLFFRFRPEVYYYGIVFLTRNLLICLVPVFPGCRDDPAFQVILMCALLLGFTCIQTLLKPWRAGITNVADGVLTSMLVLILVCGILATDFTANDHSIAIVGVVVFSFWAGVGLMSLLWFAYSRFIARGRPYRFFICHHKAGAGTFARLLKFNLARHPSVTKKVFIDSDDLKDLDRLFDTVGNETDTLIILCSREILTRPWCVGEMVTAKAKAVKVLRVVFPDFVSPDEAWIDAYESMVKDLNCLAERGISLSVVQETLRWLGTTPIISLPESGVSASTFHALVEKLVANGEGNVDFSKDSIPQNVVTAVVVDHTNSEATATGLLLAQMSITHFAQDPQCIPFVLPRGEELPSQTQNVLLICTIGAFQQPEFLQVLKTAGSRRLTFIPILADERFPIPVGEALRECKPAAASVSDHPEKLLVLIREVFHIIAISFLSNQSSEDVLKAAVTEVAVRLAKARKTFRITNKSSVTPSRSLHVANLRGSAGSDMLEDDFDSQRNIVLEEDNEVMDQECDETDEALLEL